MEHGSSPGSLIVSSAVTTSSQASAVTGTVTNTVTFDQVGRRGWPSRPISAINTTKYPAATASAVNHLSNTSSRSHTTPATGGAVSRTTLTPDAVRGRANRYTASA